MLFVYDAKKNIGFLQVDAALIKKLMTKEKLQISRFRLITDTLDHLGDWGPDARSLMAR